MTTKSPLSAAAPSCPPAVSARTESAHMQRNLKERMRSCLQQDRSEPEAIGMQSAPPLPLDLTYFKPMSDNEAAVIRQSFSVCRRITRLLGGTDI